VPPDIASQVSDISGQRVGTASLSGLAGSADRVVPGLASVGLPGVRLAVAASGAIS